MISIRSEDDSDISAIYAINQQTFGQTAEPELVNRLREAGALSHSLVAHQDDQLVGYLAISPVTIETPQAGITHGLGLGPVAVLPSWQRQGVGSALIDYWKNNLATDGDQLIVVLGHPDYYPRFGFLVAADYQLYCEYDVPREAFMVMELKKGILGTVKGQVKYHPAFNQM